MSDYPFMLEREVLKKYLKGAVILEEDRPILDEFARIGFIRKGFSLTKKRDTAIVTALGNVLFS